jgi:microcompartment protein CcmL/EutN
LGTRKPCIDDAIGIIELKTIAETIRATDAGIKGAEVDIVETRLADNIGGKAFSIFTGKLEDVLAAIRHAKDSIKNKENWLKDSIIPRLHEHMLQQLNETSRFSQVEHPFLEDGEI